jgi:type II secretory pathway component GspD/PulD (secretin)
MSKTFVAIVSIIGLSFLMCVTGVSAQEVDEAKGEGEYGFIIENALDQIEKSLDPAAAEENLSTDPVISETPETEASKDILADPQSRQTMDRAEDVQQGVVIEDDSGSDEVTLDTIISVDTEGINEALEVKVYPLEHAEASGLIEALEQIKSPEGEVSYNEEDRAIILKDTPLRLEKMSALIKETDVLLETGIFALEYATAGDIIGDVKTILTENVGQAQFDEESNSVVVTDTPENIKKIKKLIQGLDRFNVDVLIASRILKIVLNDEYLTGVDWEAIVSEYQKLLFRGEKDNAEQLSLGTVSEEDYGILLEALDTVGAASTIFEGDMTTENESTKTFSSLGSAHQDEGIQLHLTPTVKKDELLEINIKMQEDDQKGVTVQMKNGETIVIGGLFEDVMVASTWKVPLLGNLPLLGFVFRNEGQELRKAETITFLTVKAVEKKKL